MNIDDEFFIVIMNGKEICYGEYSSLAIFSSEKDANELRIDLHMKFPKETYTVEKIKIEIIY